MKIITKIETVTSYGTSKERAVPNLEATVKAIFPEAHASTPYPRHQEVEFSWMRANAGSWLDLGRVIGLKLSVAMPPKYDRATRRIMLSGAGKTEIDEAKMLAKHRELVALHAAATERANKVRNNGEIMNAQLKALYAELNDKSLDFYLEPQLLEGITGIYTLKLRGLTAEKVKAAIAAVKNHSMTVELS